MSQIQEEIESLIKKIENGELSEEEEMFIIDELNFLYETINKYLEKIKVEKLSADLKK